jgi:N-acetylneuraminic acid mutarotase
MATPDDPNLGDGFYWLLSTVTGSHKFTAGAANYSAQDVTVNVAADSASEGAFSLAAPRVTVTSGSIAKTVDWQGNGSATLTLKNGGTAPATAKISEQPVAYQPAAQGAALQKVKGNYSTARFRPGDTAGAKAASTAGGTPAALPWTAVADYPSPIMDNGAVTINGKVYSVGGVDGYTVLNKGYVYDPVTQAWTPIANMGMARENPQVATVGGKMYVTGGWDPNGGPITRTEIYDPASGAWALGADNPQPHAAAGVAVLSGKIYVVGGCDLACGITDVQVYDPAANSWSSAKAYPEPTSWIACGGIGGRLYCAGGSPGSIGTKHGYSYDPSSNAWTAIADLPIDLWGMASSIGSGQLLLSGGVTNGNGTTTNQGFAYQPDSNTWTALPNANNTLYRSAAACGLYKIGGSVEGFTVSRSIEMLPGYDQCSGAGDVPWLSVDKTEVTLQPGATATVTVRLDANVAAVTQPGTYTGQLTVGARSPYGLSSVPVSMTVNPPKTWGKITGTVTGAACVGTPAPLAGATVEIDSGSASHSLKTDRKGQYVLWLDAQKLTLIAAKEGWAPQAKSIKIAKHAAATADFTLKPDHACG